MAKLPRRTDADYVRFPPYYAFKSRPEQSARRQLWKWAFCILVVVCLAVFILVCSHFILRASVAERRIWLHSNPANPAGPNVREGV